MKNLSQRKKLLLMFLCITVIPICFISSINVFTSLYNIRKTSNEILEGRLSHDIKSAQLSLDYYVGSIEKQENKLIGQDGNDLAANTKLIEQISEQLDEQVSIYIKEGDTFSRYLTSINDPSTGATITNTQLDPSSDTYRTVINDETYVGTIDLLGNTYISAYQPLKNESGETIGLLSIAYSMTTIQSMIQSRVQWSIINILIVSMVFLVYGIIFISFASRMMTKPLINLKEKALQLADYDLSTDVPMELTNRRDEIGVVAQAMSLLIQNLRELITSVNTQSKNVTEVANELDLTCSQASTTSEELGKNVSEIAEGAASQAENTANCLQCLEILGSHVQTNNTKVNELTISSSRVNDYVNDGQLVLKELIHKIEEGNQATQAVYESIQITNQSADQISSISNMIASIAEQTNLLALNASIEAARAGEFGRGFSVVAEEIRQLAEQSAESTRQIDEQISLLQSQASNSVSTTERVKQILEEQSDSVEATETKYASITSEMSSTIAIIEELETSSKSMNQQKNTAMEHIHNLSAISEENAAAAQEASACIEEQGASLMEIANNTSSLSQMSDELAQMIQKFRL